LGDTPVNYVTKVRIQKAVELLVRTESKTRHFNAYLRGKPAAAGFPRTLLISQWGPPYYWCFCAKILTDAAISAGAQMLAP